MAKRLTDTDKWNDDWYVSLNNDYRIIWQWLLDNCSHAGICKRSIKLLNLMCNTNITEDELIKAMDNRLLVVDNNWFIPKFIKFQYPTLKSNKPVIISVIKELEKYNLLHLIPQSFGNDYIIIKDKSKDKDNVLLQQKNSQNGQPINFKAQGENLFAERIARHQSKIDKNRGENNLQSD